MEILGTSVKDKKIKLRSANILLSINELDSLINFLFKAKQHFLDRQKDESIKKMVEKNKEFKVEHIS